MKRLNRIQLLMIGMITVGLVLSSAMPSYARLRLADANNKICPVTGEEITQKKYNTGFDGKRYWFSSFAAVQKFKTDPAYYVASLEHQPVRAKKVSPPPPAKPLSTTPAQEEKERSWKLW